jgi:hypothetical protein
MPAKSVAIPITLSALLGLSACQKQPEAPSADPVAPQPTATVVVTTPATAAPAPRRSNVVVAQEPTLCGAEKLSNYLNLLPTATAKDEIARTAGHNRIRYVGPNDVTTREFRADRLTAEMGVDGRIKEFRCN